MYSNRHACMYANILLHVHTCNQLGSGLIASYKFLKRNLQVISTRKSCTLLIPGIQPNAQCTFRYSIGKLHTSNKHNTLIQFQNL